MKTHDKKSPYKFPFAAMATGENYFLFFFLFSQAIFAHSTDFNKYLTNYVHELYILYVSVRTIISYHKSLAYDISSTSLQLLLDILIHIYLTL